MCISKKSQFMKSEKRIKHPDANQLYVMSLEKLGFPKKREGKTSSVERKLNSKNV